MSEGATRVVHVHDKVPGAVYIGRATRNHKRSPLANPFVIGNDGTRAEVIERYSFWIGQKLGEGDLGVIRALIECDGKPIACWCRHDGAEPTDANRCHGDIIVLTLEMWPADDLQSMLEEPDRLHIPHPSRMA